MEEALDESSGVSTMLVIVRTLTNRKFEVVVPEDATVGRIKTLLMPMLGVPELRQRLVFQGRLLGDDERTLQAEKIGDGDMCVVYLGRNVEEPEGPDPSKAPDMKEIVKTTGGGVDASGEPAPASDSSVRDFLSFLSSSLSQAQAAATAPTATTASIPCDPVALQQLSDMGFPPERARKALILNRMNTQRAMDWLLVHSGDPDIDQPLTRAELDRIQRPRDHFVPDVDAVQALAEMGFGEEAVIQALRATGNNQEAACAFLLGEQR